MARAKKAAIFGDQLVGIGIKIVKPVVPIIPPFPFPLPFNGTFNQMLTFTVRIQGKAAAVFGSVARSKRPAIPPPGTTFVIPPRNMGFLVQGSRTVSLEKRKAGREGDLGIPETDIPAPTAKVKVKGRRTVFIG